MAVGAGVEVRVVCGECCVCADPVVEVGVLQFAVVVLQELPEQGVVEAGGCAVHDHGMEHVAM